MELNINTTSYLINIDIWFRILYNIIKTKRIKYNKEFRKIKIKCECGMEIFKKCKSVHIKSDRHIKAIKMI